MSASLNRVRPRRTTAVAVALTRFLKPTIAVYFSFPPLSFFPRFFSSPIVPLLLISVFRTALGLRYANCSWTLNRIARSRVSGSIFRTIALHSSLTTCIINRKLRNYSVFFITIASSITYFNSIRILWQKRSPTRRSLCYQRWSEFFNTLWRIGEHNLHPNHPSLWTPYIFI